MSDQPTGAETCWTLIRDAAAGEDRSRFSHRYVPVVRAFLAARWKGSPLANDLDDALQEVFLECFRERGALAKAEEARGVRFRAYLFGIVRNVALRFERSVGRAQGKRRGESFALDEVPGDDQTSRQFERTWALAMIREAAALQKSEARAGDDDARRRVELLELRFQGELPIREIAARWEEDVAVVHQAYRRARQEYRDCLLRVVAFHDPGSPDEIERECQGLIGLLEKG